MAGRDRRSVAAYVEDEDALGNVLPHTRVSAASSVAAASPIKERPNVSKSRTERVRRLPASPTANESDSSSHPTSILRRESKPKTKERSSKDKERRSSSKAPRSSEPRPSTRHASTTPALQTTRSSRRVPTDDPSFYGVSPVVTPSTSSRPRASTSHQRPSSYYGATSRPPLSNNKYWQNPTPALASSYIPQQQWAPPPAPPMNYAPQYMPPPPQAQPVDYFTQAHSAPPLQRLASRLNRPQSAMAQRSSGLSFAQEFEQEMDRAITRRTSTSTKKSSRSDKDRSMMPPPPRPNTTRPPRSSPFAPPPTTSHHRRSLVIDDDDDDDDDDDEFFDQVMQQAVSPLTHYDYGAAAAARPSLGSARRPSIDTSNMLYDLGPFQAEIAGRARRDSYLDRTPSGGSGGFDDKIRLASTYQDEVSGGSILPLTAEALRKASKVSTRTSTKSSGSRDESDYKRSATTRTSLDNDDVNIVIKGMTTLRVGGVDMECHDGAEININSRQGTIGGGANTIRGGASEHASSVYDDQYLANTRYGRHDRPQIRHRASSQAGSYSRRGLPMPMVDQYGYPLVTSGQYI